MVRRLKPQRILFAVLLSLSPFFFASKPPPDDFLMTTISFSVGSSASKAARVHVATDSLPRDDFRRDMQFAEVKN